MHLRNLPRDAPPPPRQLTAGDIAKLATFGTLSLTLLVLVVLAAAYPR